MRFASPAILLLTSLAACTPTAMPGATSDGSTGDDDDDVPADAATGECVNPADPFAPSVLEDGLGYLASDALGGRSSNSDGDRATRTFIEDAFRCAGLVPGGPAGFQQPFTAPDGTQAANVVGILRGSDPALADEVIIVGAHHDHLGTMGGQIYNGANDNASGTIALIAQARALAAANPKRTIGFVAFGYEEHDGNCEGSEYYAAHAPAELANVVYMVDMDMVGTYALANELTIYGANTGTRGRTILNGLAGTYSDLAFAHSGNADTDDSDFQAFADRGVPYVYFETWDEACYHQPCDDANRIDYAGMAQVAKLGRDVISQLAN